MKINFIVIVAILLVGGCKDAEITPEEPQVPRLLTSPISNLTVFSVYVSGKVIDSLGSDILEQGIVIDTIPGPTKLKSLNKYVLKKNTSGEFGVTITALLPAKKFYLKAYAENSIGTGYGDEVTFLSLPEKQYGDVTLTTQQEVIEFGQKSITTIDGDLLITGSVQNLSPLEKLTIVNGSVEIKANSGLTNFSGLEALEIITGGLRIENNPALTNFVGLNRLAEVDGLFYVINNDNLINLAGLNNLEIINRGGEFRIQGCDKLINLDGLEMLKYIAGNLILIDNSLLENIHGLKNLLKIFDRLYVTNNPALKDLNGLEKVIKIDDGIDIENNSSLSNINALGNLTTGSSYGSGVINLNGNNKLDSLPHFKNITVLDYLILKDNSLKSINGLSTLKSVRYGLTIENNVNLIDLKGLEQLEVSGNLNIIGNSLLTDLKGLKGLTKATINIAIMSNENLTGLSGLENLKTIEGWISIAGNIKLADFCPLKPLLISGYDKVIDIRENALNPDRAEILSCQ